MFGYAGLRAAHRARDRYSKLLAAGLTCLIMGQASINLFAVLGLAPLTGVPLPFVSYGGSSLVVTLISAGLILNVARGPAAMASAAPRSNRGRARRLAAGGGAKLRLLDGEGYSLRRNRTKRDTGRDSGRRHRRARGAGDGRRRRAAR
jgi:cell division protein FtsW